MAGKRCLQLLADRAARVDARAEVALDEGRPEVAQVLDVDGVVEAVLPLDLRDRLRRRALAEQRLRGPAGQGPDPREDEDREPEQDRDEEQQPADDEAKHSFANGRPPARYSDSVPSSPLSDRDGREGLVRGRARHVALDVRAEAERRLRVRVRHGRQEVHDQAVRLLVGLLACGLVRLGLALVEQSEQLGVAEAELRRERLEEDADEVVRVGEVARPADQVEVAGRPLVDAAQVVRAPRRAVRRDLEAGLVQAGREGLEVPLRVRHVRPGDVGRVPEVDRHRQRQAGLLEQLLRLLRVVRVLGDVVRVAHHLGRHHVLRDDAAAAVEVVHDGLAVEAVGNRLPHLELVHRLLGLVDGHVGHVERRPLDRP